MVNKKKPGRIVRDIYFATVSGADKRPDGGVIEIEKFKAIPDKDGTFFTCKNPCREPRYVDAERIGKPHDFRTYGWAPEEAENALRLGLRIHADALEKEAKEARRRAELPVFNFNLD